MSGAGVEPLAGPRHASLDVVVARLALGRPADDWIAGAPRPLLEQLLRVAQTERCSALIWTRAGQSLRDLLPTETANQWRQHAISIYDRAKHQASVLNCVVASLEEAGIAPVALKGLPLSAHVYGDFAVRPSADIDLYVPRDQRATAHALLLAAGWRHLDGEAPRESSYRSERALPQESLELHSRLLDHTLTAHLELEPRDGMIVAVDGCAVKALSGPVLALFLAVHLAQHARTPLLWWIDFTSLWTSLDARSREAAYAAARHARCGRYLKWAELGACLLTHAVGSEDWPTQSLADLRALHAAHPVRRVAHLASNPVDKWRVFGAWALPRHLRREPTVLLKSSLRRIGRRFASLPRVSEPPMISRDVDGQFVSVRRDELAEMIRGPVGAGGAVWIKAKGSSMRPAIPPGTLVRLEAIPAHGPVPGDVVLAIFPDGKPVLHRVLRCSGPRLTLKGDNLPVADAEIRTLNALAQATAVQINGQVISMYDRPRNSLRLVLGRWRMRLRHRLRHG